MLRCVLCVCACARARARSAYLNFASVKYEVVEVDFLTKSQLRDSAYKKVPFIIINGMQVFFFINQSSGCRFVCERERLGAGVGSSSVGGQQVISRWSKRRTHRP